MSKKDKPVNAAKPKKKSGGIGKFFLALVMAIVVFIALLVLQTGIMNKYEKKTVVIAKTDISANIDITKDNLKQYFTTTDYDVTKLPAGYIEKNALEETLSNVLVTTYIPKGQVITDSVFVTSDSVTGQLAKLEGAELVETSFSVDSIADAVAGTLRRGDVIDIYLYYVENTEDSQFSAKTDMKADIQKVVLKDIHIKQAYDGSGVAITEDNKDAAAVLFDIVANEEDVDKLNELLVKRDNANGSLKMTIVKINDVAF